MATMTSTTLLFLPYDKKKSFDHDNVQSRQQHTALEYHRKRKLSKNQSRSSVSRIACTARANDSASTPQSVVYSPGTSTSDDSETNATELSHPRIIGKWRLDPFDALRDIHVPEYVQEMLDHGKLFRNICYRGVCDFANVPRSHKTSMGPLRSFAEGDKEYTSRHHERRDEKSCRILLRRLCRGVSSSMAGRPALELQPEKHDVAHVVQGGSPCLLEEGACGTSRANLRGSLVVDQSAWSA